MKLKDRFSQNKLTIGTWMTLANPAIAEIFTNAGYDWIAIDLEHSVISIREAAELIRVIDLNGGVPLVRLSSNDDVQIKRVMDAGAHGIIVPMVNTAEEARRAVSSVRYPPEGTRGVGLARAQGYGNSFETYFDRSNKEIIVIVQVEHIDAVNNLEAILAVDGVDGYFIGPYDLSCSLGIPGQFEHPLMKEALLKIHKIGQTSEKVSGIHVVEPQPEELMRNIESGYKFIAYSVDIRMLDCMCRTGVRALLKMPPSG